MKDLFMYDKPKRVVSDKEIRRYLSEKELVKGVRLHVDPALVRHEDYVDKMNDKIALTMGKYVMEKATVSVSTNDLMGGSVVSAKAIVMTEQDLIDLLHHFEVIIHGDAK